MATEEQLTKAYLQARESGDAEKTQIYGSALKKMRSAPTQQAEDTSERGNIAQQVLQGATFNLSDEIEGGIGSIFANFVSLLTPDSEITGKSLANEGTMGYDEGVDLGRRDLDAFAERNPITATVAQIGGGLATGGLGAAKALGSQAMKQAPRLAKIALTPAIYGAEGAVAGFGQGENMEERIDKAGEQGAIAAVLGPLLQLGGTQASKWISGKKAKMYQDALSPNKSVDDITAQSKAFYKTADESGVTLKPEVWDEFRTNLRLNLKAEDVYDELPGAMRKMEKHKMPSYKQLEGLKRKVSRQRTNYTDDVKRGTAEDFSRSIDDLVAGLEPDDVLQGNVDNLGEHLEEARGLWARKSQLDTLDDIANRSRLSEASIQGDADKALRSAIRPNLLNPRKKMGLSEDLVNSLDDIVMGKTPGASTGRGLASVAPSSHSARGMFPVATGGALTPGGRMKAIVNLLPVAAGKVGKVITGKSSAAEFNKLRAKLLNLDRPDLADALEEVMRSHDPIIKGMAAGTGRTAPSLEQIMNGEYGPQ